MKDSVAFTIVVRDQGDGTTGVHLRSEPWLELAELGMHGEISELAARCMDEYSARIRIRQSEDAAKRSRIVVRLVRPEPDHE